MRFISYQAFGSAFNCLASALAEAGKRQILLNILKLRYGDVPAFVSVSQILAGYSVQGTFSVGTELLSGNSLRLSDDANVGIGGTFTMEPYVGGGGEIGRAHV